ncbi:hypothetical protein ACIPY5_06255 [Microbacterium sp. NPDC089698]|uniref:hypothetical protein n=1 Tax=Microbacterium sp. NPDC089698 TaxID=3364200 RepID=UPI00382D0E02
MDPFWAVAAELWWTAPVIAGAGAVIVLGARRGAAAGGRRLGYDAARLDLQSAQRAATEARLAVRVARAELAGRVAGRAAGSAHPAEVSDARRALRDAETGAKAASAAVRARRAQVEAARADLALNADPQRRPLPRAIAAHDAVVARWMAYETDPAKLIAYPSIGDAGDPSTAAFLRALDEARQARPDPARRIAAAEFGAYRDAVARLERAFDTAERDAHARAEGRDPERERATRATGWQDTAQQVIAMSADALDRAADAAASAIAAWNARERGPKQRKERD